MKRTEAASVQQERVRLAVLAVAAAVEPDERYDPADDPRIAEALEQVANGIVQVRRERRRRRGCRRRKLAWSQD